jgi:hypothetical protein
MELTVWSWIKTHTNLYFFAMLAYQILLWVVTVRLHIYLKCEDIFWDECIGKIRSASMRALGNKEELEALKAHHYSPIVDRLVVINFFKIESPVIDRCLLLSSIICDWLCNCLIRWLWLSFVYATAIWLMIFFINTNDKLLQIVCHILPLWIWLIYAVCLMQKQIKVWRGLERVKHSLLIPHQD